MHIQLPRIDLKTLPQRHQGHLLQTPPHHLGLPPFRLQTLHPLPALNWPPLQRLHRQDQLRLTQKDQQFRVVQHLTEQEDAFDLGQVLSLLNRLSEVHWQ